jgi:TPR repeat protein
MYEQGRGGLAKDAEEAVRLYRLSADQGNDLGKRHLTRLCGALIEPAGCPK